MSEANSDEVRELRRFVTWSGNTIHQAYHRDGPYETVGWLECGLAHCREARAVLGHSDRPGRVS